MATVVMKFGGSSVADVSKLKRVASQLLARHRAGDKLVVVVSAMGKTTDRLIAQAHEVTSDPPRRELDMLVTAGERISMALLSMAIHDAGAQAISFTGSQSGIITTETHQGAKIIDVRPIRIPPELDRGRIVIVAGFQGVSLEREVTTLGRGGSDTTAVALAAALRADACEIYSDVDGVYTADPRVVPEARLLARLTYEVMLAMSRAGAKVLNAEAVSFAQRAGLTILARKTDDPSGRQTLVSANVESVPAVAAVVGAACVSRVRLRDAHSAAMARERIEAAGGRVMAQANARDAGGAGGGARCVTWLVDRTDVPGRAAAPVRQALVGVTDAIDEVAAVSVVGEALGEVGINAAGIGASLREVGIEFGDAAVSARTVTGVVAEGAGDDAVRFLHSAYCGDRAAGDRAAGDRAAAAVMPAAATAAAAAAAAAALA